MYSIPAHVYIQYIQHAYIYIWQWWMSTFSWIYLYTFTFSMQDFYSVALVLLLRYSICILRSTSVWFLEAIFSNLSHNLGSNCCGNVQTVFLIGPFMEAVMYRHLIGQHRSSCVLECSERGCCGGAAAAPTHWQPGSGTRQSGESLRAKPACSIKNNHF